MKQEILDFKRRRIICLIATLIICVCVGFVYAWSVLQNPIIEQYGWENSKVALGYTVMIICSNVIALVLGSWIKKVSIRTCILVGAVLFGGGLIASGFMGQLWQLYIFYGVLTGFGNGLIYPQMMSYVVKLFPERAGVASGLGTASYGSGAVIWAPAATAFIGQMGVSSTFKVLGLVFLIVCVAFAMLLKDPPEGFREALVETKYSVAVDSVNDMTRGQMLKTRAFYLIVATFSCGLVAGVIIISNASPILQSALAYSPERAALFVSVFSLCNMGGRFLWGSLSDKIGLYNAITGVFIVCVVATALMAFVNIEIIMLIAMGLAASCYGGLASNLTPLTGKMFGHKNLTSNFGCMYVVYGFASLIGPVLATTFKTESGGYTITFLVSCILALIGLVIVQLLRRKK